jgi:hypothetical protein
MAGIRNSRWSLQAAGQQYFTGAGLAFEFNVAGRGKISMAAGSPSFTSTRNLSLSVLAEPAAAVFVQVKDDLPCALTARA